MEAYRIILADDHPIIRQGIKKLLGENPDLEVVGEAADGQEVLELLSQTQPDLILLDIQMPRLGGLEAAHAVKQRYPQMKVLILTMHKEDSYLSVAQEIGVDGFVLKDDIDQVLLDAISALRTGETFTSPLLEALPAEAEVRKTQRALFQSEMRYRSLVDLSPDAILVHDEGEIVFVNPAAVALFGAAAPGDLLGRPLVDFIHPEARAKLRENIQKIQNGEPVGHAEEKILRLNGGAVEVEGISGSIMYQDRPAVQSIFRDITRRKRAEAERLQLSKLESLGILAAGIAHDFNNSLTAILGNIGLALLDKLEGPTQERLAEAEKACLQAQTLAWQLLTFAKGGVPVKELLSIAKLIMTAGSFACGGTNARCRFNLPNDLWDVEADPGQIGQVVQNLVINAVQAMPAGGTITMSGENLTISSKSILPLAPGRYVKISIRDQGTGIPDKYLPKIFDPYFTTKHQGSGLGLAVAYSIIKNHQGHIAVTSTLGEGTTFHIYLPASSSKFPQPLRESTQSLSGTGKILIMDDDALVRDVLGKMLISLGYEVELARDGAEALALYARAQDNGGPFAGVILDLTVPNGLGGKETMARLLRLDPQVKALVSSGYSDDPIMADYQKYGFAGVIPKPYKISELGKVLKESLAGAE
jgi:two-component system, cell cycle sensor histidine kinase and response regulator CckA